MSLSVGLHIWTSEYDCVLAFDEDDARSVVWEQTGDTCTDEFTQWPDGKPFTMQEDDEPPRTLLPLEWAASLGRGYMQSYSGGGP